MNLSQPSMDNIAFMVTEIQKKLKMASVGAVKPEHFDESAYEDIKDIYDLVMGKQTFSINEMEALAKELGKLRKS